jgi:hypothetical protein
MDALAPTFAIGALELIAAYVLVAVILLAILLWARIRWWIKAVAIVLSTALFFTTFESVRALLGWPTEQVPPDRFELVYAMINEPNQATRAPGAIFIWVLELPGEGPIDEDEIYVPGAIDTRLEPGQEPRAYRLAYSRETHQEVEEAKIKLLDGVRQIGVTDRKMRKPGEHAPNAEFSFYERPDPVLPPKGPEPE